MVIRVSLAPSKLCKPLTDLGYHAWRRLGDVISSVFALGYHEQIQNIPATSPSVIALRRAAFARCYSYDKNVAVFLGRPPRLSRRYCNIQLYSNDARSVRMTSHSVVHPTSFEEWPQPGQLNYTSDARWSFLCALCKEDILELRKEESQDERARRAQ